MQEHFGSGFAVALTAIFWRESWKYGERAYRYCSLDTGHALAALAFAARLHNWRCIAVSGAGDDQLATLLGMDRTAWWPLEREAPELFCWVSTGPGDRLVSQKLPDSLASSFSKVAFSGRPNRLSAQAMDWVLIEQAADATCKSSASPQPLKLPKGSLRRRQPVDQTAAAVIRRRRSAAKFDPKGYIAKELFGPF